MKNMFQPLALRGDDGLIRAVDGIKNKGFLMLPYSLNDLKYSFGMNLNSKTFIHKIIYQI